MPEENVLVQLNQTLTQLDTLLGSAPVREAVSKIPASLKGPIVQGLTTVLNAIEPALEELKNNLGSVTTLHDLLTAIDGLLTAAGGLAPAQQATIAEVKRVVSALNSLPSAAEINEILTKIQSIIDKLQGL